MNNFCKGGLLEIANLIDIYQQHNNIIVVSLSTVYIIHICLNLNIMEKQNNFVLRKTIFWELKSLEFYVFVLLCKNLIEKIEKLKKLYIENNKKYN